MKTEIVEINLHNRKEILEKASLIIKRGGLVVFPTETVYGVGANIFNEEALKKIFIVKGRPSDNPLIVHISNKNQLNLLTDSISKYQERLMNVFWPGPLTIIFPKKKEISNIVSGGLNTIAIRMPSDIFAKELVEESGCPIAAPSANESGKPSGTLGKDVIEDLTDKVDMIIDGGHSLIGVESTVVKVLEDKVLILRPGAITKEMIEKVLYDIPVLFAKEKTDLDSSPGTKYRHYAPEPRLEIIPFSLSVGENMISRLEELSSPNLKIGVMISKQNEEFLKGKTDNIFILGDENNLEEISKNLYSGLRFFNDKGVDVILCQSFKKEGLGVAIMDRLERASSI